jgi:hypothetical protein
MHTFALTLLFVVLNGTGFLYRIATHKHEAAHTTGVLPSPIVAAPVLVTVPVAAVTIAPAVAAAPAAPTVDPEIPQSPKPAPSLPTPVRHVPQRRPAVVSHSPVVVHPHGAEPEEPPAPTKADTKSDSAAHSDENLQKMEANPYKRGE